ncbi:complex I intermediate-associated protein 30 [Cordyceps fumosorosea ARSEF 2679]|uniref:Complex I intermediate-associated protein 30 n=1 Tax=Cordyceps fumosorosea (strain ARSEF 2679) TaxID=1081104 RepID=A0A167T101_CORFA|nr:complex I intermediate-associated protein 30 [Cordyceps fumosorosea ARSEF 2679]OAA60136.1 complex I intermediate-associated protein 30 [Cordyceps fumosorosea ARSEF 2679]
MRATQPQWRKSFLSRSLDELKRRSSIAWNLEAVKGPQGPRTLYEFTDSESTRDCILMSDDLIGGSSKSHLDYVTCPSTSLPSTATSTSSSSSSSSSSSPSSYARFHGSISTALPSDRLKIKRTGYAAFRTPNQAPTLFGKSVWDIDPYTYLALRVKSDGRAYFVNVQTEGVEPTDLHQHRLFAKRPGQWETVLIKWNDFVRTNYGFVVEPQTEILRQRVATVGVGLTDRVEGPFELCIQRVWATNQPPDIDGPNLELHGGLKTKQGDRIKW